MKKFELTENMDFVKSASADGRLFWTVEAAQKLVDFYRADNEEVAVVEVLEPLPRFFDDEPEVSTFGYIVVFEEEFVKFEYFE